MRNIKYTCLILAVIMLLPFSLKAQHSSVGSAFRIVESNAESIRINFELPDWKLEKVEDKGETLSKIMVEDTQYIFIGEEETLPVFTTMIAVPYSGGVILNDLGLASESNTQVKMGFDSLLAGGKSCRKIHGRALSRESGRNLRAPGLA